VEETRRVYIKRYCTSQYFVNL